MRFSERWLRQYVDPALSTEELAHALTMAGLEVESYAPFAPPFGGVVVGKVLAVARHDQADKLSVCQVDLGLAAPEQIVCGAPNVRVGMTVACARPGAVLPNGMAIAVATVRGVASHGMLCSARELGLTQDSAGLLELPVSAPVGVCVRQVLDLDDPIWVLKITPNLAHCMSVIGVAREVAALTGAPLRLPPSESIAPGISDTYPVMVETAPLCGRFACRLIRGVNARAETPAWMRERLERAGQRCISALVDISNYVMLEWGQPSHMFDCARLEGPLEVRWGRPGEQLVLLNGQTVAVGPAPDDLQCGVVADARQVVSVAGIMGGQDSAVTLDTRDVLIEAAFWWPDALAGRARRLQCVSDAAQRFERGVDPQQTVARLEVLTRLVIEICGGQPGPVSDHVTALPERLPVAMRVARARKVLGLPVQTAECVAVFERLGMEVQTVTVGPDPALDAVLHVTPASYRFDLAIEEDLIEEVLRLIGLERLPDRPPRSRAVLQKIPDGAVAPLTLLRRLVEHDWQEVIHYAFIADAVARRLDPHQEPIAVRNPIAEQLNVLRTTLWGGLIQTLQHNVQRQSARVRLFEVGRVFARSSGPAGPWDVAGISQPCRLAGLAYGPLWPYQWGTVARPVDFYDVKADLAALLPEPVRYQAARHPALHPGQSAQIRSREGVVLGWLGVLHPHIWQSLDLPGASPVLFELDWTFLLHRAQVMFKPFARVPALLRDLAWVLEAHVPAGDVQAYLHECCATDPGLLTVRHIILFDEYRAKGLENKEKSLAFRFWIQDTERTLSDAQADAVTRQLDQLMQVRFNARLRSS